MKMAVSTPVIPTALNPEEAPIANNYNCHHHHHLSRSDSFIYEIDSNNNENKNDFDVLKDLKRGISVPRYPPNYVEIPTRKVPVSIPLQGSPPNHGPDNETLLPLGVKPLNYIQMDTGQFDLIVEGSHGDLPSQREIFLVQIPDEVEGDQNEREKMKRACSHKWFVDSRTVWANPEFRNPSTRGRFVRKVFLILFLQFLFSILWTLSCLNITDVNCFVKTNHWIMYLCGGLCIVFYVIIGCFSSVGKTFPFNVIILTIFSCCVSYICGAATVRYSTETILLCCGYVAGMCVFLMLLTFFSKIDVTAWGVGIMVVGATGMLYGGAVAFCSFLIEEDETLGILQITAAAIGGILISIYLLYDLQMLIGGRRTELSEEDWLYAAMSLFYDIVMMFTYLLKMVRVFNNR